MKIKLVGNKLINIEETEETISKDSFDLIRQDLLKEIKKAYYTRTSNEEFGLYLERLSKKDD